MDYIGGHPPRPHKPKKELGWVDKHPEETEQIVLKALEKEKADIQHLLPSTARVPIITGSTGPSQYVTGSTGPGLVPRSGATGPTPLAYYRGEPVYDDVDYVYEFGKAEPVAFINNSYSLHEKINARLQQQIEALESDGNRFLQLEAEQKNHEEYMHSLRKRMKEFNLTDSTGPK